MLDTYREDRRTGLIRLAYEQEKRLHLFFKRGEVLNSYLTAPGSLEALSLDQGMDCVQGIGEAYVREATLSPFAVLMCKLLLQTRDGEKENFSTSLGLVDFLQSLAECSEPHLALLEWDHAAGAVFFAVPPVDTRSIFIAPYNLLDEEGVSSAFGQWKELYCSAAKFKPDPTVDAWQEYYLRRSFAQIFELALARFETLTGRVMVDSLIRLLVILAAREDLEINIYARRLVDREVFSSPQQAAQSYCFLLTELFQHFAVVVGSRLLASILNEIVASLPPIERETIRTFALIPPGNIYDEKYAKP